MIIYKKASGKQTVPYEQLVEVALCYGWIDGMMKGLDAEKYAQRFSPRRKRSSWTEANRAIARRLIEEGRMTEAGLAVLPSHHEAIFARDSLYLRPRSATRRLRTNDITGTP